MFHRPLFCLIVAGLALLGRPAAQALEVNVWPFWVEQEDTTGAALDWQAAGPLLFHSAGQPDATYGGLRPLFLQKQDATGQAVESTVLYPLFVSRRFDQGTRWSVFDLINRTQPDDTTAPGAVPASFEVWPFWFSRDTGDAASSYQALFPIAGTIKDRFGYDRLHWALFPFFWQSERQGVITTSTPWPFIKQSHGPGGEEGFSIWPLFGHRVKPGDFQSRYWLWPLIYKSETGFAGPQPTVKEGFLPFYARVTGPREHGETFLWPFFGYTDLTGLKPYHEIRYLWPLMVQGRGSDHYVNRWGPFYTHSIVQGVDKRWWLWPLLRRQQWTDDGLVQTKDQFLWFVFWSMEQRSAAHPDLPVAIKSHLWPLFSQWDNGAGRAQVQVLSPFAVFFPNNEEIARLYNPLFALYRYDQRSPADRRWSLLWNAVSWHHAPAVREFHLGPILATRRSPAGRDITLGAGLIRLHRPSGGKWHLSLFDFSRRPAQPAPAKHAP